MGRKQAGTAVGRYMPIVPQTLSFHLSSAQGVELTESTQTLFFPCINSIWLHPDIHSRQGKRVVNPYYIETHGIFPLACFAHHCFRAAASLCQRAGLGVQSSGVPRLL